jgi:hypothetical protein
MGNAYPLSAHIDLPRYLTHLIDIRTDKRVIDGSGNATLRAPGVPPLRQ